MVDIDWRFRGSYCLYYQGNYDSPVDGYRRQSTTRRQPFSYSSSEPDISQYNTNICIFLVFYICEICSFPLSEITEQNERKTFTFMRLRRQQIFPLICYCFYNKFINNAFFNSMWMMNWNWSVNKLSWKKWGKPQKFPWWTL